MSIISKWKIYCNTEQKFYYVWNNNKINYCPNNSQHSINELAINHIFNVYKYKIITNLDSPMYLSSYNFYRCDTVNGNINFILNIGSYFTRYIIIQKLSDNYQLNINNQFILTKHLETIKLCYENQIWKQIPIESFEGEIDVQLEPSLYNNSNNSNNVDNFGILIKNSDPSSNNDISENLFPGSLWINTQKNVNFTMTNNQLGNAIWKNNNYETITSNFLTITDTTSLELNFNDIPNKLLAFQDNTIKSIDNLDYNQDLNILTINSQVNLNNNLITNLLTPVNNSDAATKGYVDQQINNQLQTKIWEIYRILPTATNGGTPILESWTTLELTNITGSTQDVTINANVITILPGTYDISITACFHKTNSTAIRLFNITNNTTIKKSNNYYVKDANNIHLNARIIISSITNYQIEYYVTNNDSNTGLGYPIGINNESEIYVNVVILQNNLL